MFDPTPTTNSSLPLKRAEFETLTEGLDYAAKGETGCNFYNSSCEIGERLRHGELRDQAMAMARRFVRAGLARGERVASVAETNPDFLIFFFACQYAGLIPVPLPLPMNLGGHDPYVQRIERMIQSAGAVAAVAPATVISFLDEAIADLDIAMTGTPEDFLALPEDGAELRPFTKDDPCYIQYSSGSTRFPRGVAVSQHSSLSNMRAITHDGLTARPGDRCVSWLPLYHDMGLVGFTLSPILSQLSIDYIATSDFVRRPLLWPKVISANAGTLSFSPTLGYDLCSRRALNGSANAIDLSSWRVAGIGGDMIRPDVLERFRDTFSVCGFRGDAFVASYGLAESTLAVSFAPVDGGIDLDRINRKHYSTTHRAVPAGDDVGDSGARSFVVCGHAMPGHDIEIRDDSGTRQPDRRIDRIFIKGPSVMSGYFQDPEMTAGILDDDGWLDTGDMGYMIDGDLVITGRTKDLIICNGRNIWPQDIEWAVEQLAGVRTGDVAAFSVTGDDGVEQVVIVMASRLTDDKSRLAIVRQIEATVRSTAGVGCDVVLAPPRSLPHTSSGKLSRSSVKETYLAGNYPDQAVAHAAEQARVRASVVRLAAAD
ncbi:MAG: fatty acyl-AMP ligase [Pseudomonadota bacterium]|nr:fatty acyl-AMP ligase [Pseudomonadota bacterium]